MFNNPLVTIILFSYNHSKYIELAVKSILAQNYSPLEVIISDDCSSDDTFIKIKGIVDTYKGPHDIVVNRNDSNIGVGLHVSKALSMAKGEYIFLSAGDDISLFDRVSSVLAYWESLGSEYKAIFSNLNKIDDSGKKLGKYFSKKPYFASDIVDVKSGLPCWSIGASFAIHRSLYDLFGDLVLGVIQEDGCLAFRALISGKLGYYDKVTVKYRVHENNASQALSFKKKIFLKKYEYILWKSYLRDAEILQVDSSVLKLLKKQLVVKFITSKIISFPLIGYPFFGSKSAVKFFLCKVVGVYGHK